MREARPSSPRKSEDPTGTTLHLAVDPSAALPIFAQIMEQTKLAISSGRLAAGDRLPSVRELATRLRVNRNTVAKAYAQLERERVLVTRVGEGSFVAERTSWLETPERHRLLGKRLDAVISEAYHLSVPLQALETLVGERIAAFEQSLAARTEPTPKKRGSK